MKKFLRHIIPFGFLATSLLTMAQSDNWIPIAASDTITYYALKESASVKKNKAGEQIVIFTVKSDNKKTKDITLEKMYVTVDHCLKKQGKAVVLNMDGEYKYEYDFIYGAGSVGSAKAEIICDMYGVNVEERNKKGV